jgi:hypothetical protein
MFTAVYGDGAARLELLVGGDLDLRGGGAPRSSSSSWAGWNEFGAEMGRMGEELGREFSRLGDELGRELGEAFGPHGKFGPGKWSNKEHRKIEQRVRKKVEEQMRRAEERARQAEERARQAAERAQRAGEAAGRHAEEHARRAEEHARRAEEHGGRMHVRINDREWRFDAERLERLKQQAREAANEGIAGALEAVERAIAGLGFRPEPPAPPPPPVPPRGQPAAPPPPPRAPATGQTIKIDVAPEAQADAAADAPGAEPPNVEEERAAILRMVAEGRISPDEGDMLLDALG